MSKEKVLESLKVMLDFVDKTPPEELREMFQKIRRKVSESEFNQYARIERDILSSERPRRGEGKSRNSVNHVQKFHFQVGAIAACNSLVLVPTFTKDPKQTNCVNCLNYITANGIK